MKKAFRLYTGSWYYIGNVSCEKLDSNVLCSNSVGFATRTAGMAVLNLTLFSSSRGESQLFLDKTGLV